MKLYFQDYHFQHSQLSLLRNKSCNEMFHHDRLTNDTLIIDIILNFTSMN